MLLLLLSRRWWLIIVGSICNYLSISKVDTRDKRLRSRSPWLMPFYPRWSIVCFGCGWLVVGAWGNRGADGGVTRVSCGLLVCASWADYREGRRSAAVWARPDWTVCLWHLLTLNCVECNTILYAAEFIPVYRRRAQQLKQKLTKNCGYAIHISSFHYKFTIKYNVTTTLLISMFKSAGFIFQYIAGK